MATLYIHIGTPKTGTTSIQDFLALNEPELKKHGVLHPHIDIPEFRNGRFERRFIDRRNADFLAFQSRLSGKEAREAQIREVYRKGFEIIREAAKQWGKILITDEAIWSRQYHPRWEGNFWKNILHDAGEAGCEVKVVVYLRRQDLYAQAMWNQAVKYRIRTSLTFSEFLESKTFLDRRPNYYETLCDIAGQVGKENLIVRIFEKNRFLSSKTGIYEDFLDAVGEPMREEYSLDIRKKNDRLVGNYIEIKRLMNENAKFQEMPAFADNWLQKLNEEKPAEKVSYFSYEDQVKFLAQFEESNRRLAREFLGRADGVLFTEPVERLPKWEPDPETMYEDIIRLFTEIISFQEKKLIKHSERIEQLERKVQQQEHEMYHPGAYLSTVGRKVSSKMKKRQNRSM